MRQTILTILLALFLFGCTKKVLEDVVDDYIPPPASVVDMQFNFHIVDSLVWRSSQPNRESILRMKNHGLKSIINLRGDEETDLWEGNLADSLGVTYFSKPMDSRYEQDLDYLKEILSIVEDKNNQPVLIHCLGGKDRTRLIVAMYKLKNSNISMEELKKEIIMYGHDADNFTEIFSTLERYQEEGSPDN